MQYPYFYLDVLIMQVREYNNQDINATRAYYNARSAQFVKDYLYGNQRVVAAVGFAVRQLGHNQPIHRLLDIGCGLGWTTFEMARHFPNARVHGVELSDGLIDLAQRLFHLPNLTYQTADVLGLNHDQLENGFFNAILLIDVYEHIAKDQRSVFHNLINRILSSTGTVIITIPSHRHQAHLYDKYPEALQPVDEVVNHRDILFFADSIGANIHHFEHVSIWKPHDYVHVALTREQTAEKNDNLLVYQRMETPLGRIFRVCRHASEYMPSLREMVIRIYIKINRR
jgi:cyclopropane fatty-acyl-phospholipid synthase-like methyltransferase